MKTLNSFFDAHFSDLCKRFGAFFAVSNSQFEEAQVHGVNYQSMGSSLYVPKHHVVDFLDEFDKIRKSALLADFREHGAARIIEREYFNYETQLTGDHDHLKEMLSDYFEQFPESFTFSLFSDVCRKCYTEAVKNDWF
jgi:hypothetical protein